MPAILEDGPVPESVRRAYGYVIARDTAGLTPALEAEIRSATPGEALSLLFGNDWYLHAELPVKIPPEYSGSTQVLQYRTVLLTNPEHVMLACRIKTHEFTPSISGHYAYDWVRLTPVQKLNALKAALFPSILGLGPDGLLSTIARAVNAHTFGDDPTNWIAAARLILDHAHHPDTDPSETEAVEAALFLARLGNPRFARLIDHP